MLQPISDTISWCGLKEGQHGLWCQFLQNSKAVYRHGKTTLNGQCKRCLSETIHQANIQVNYQSAVRWSNFVKSTFHGFIVPGRLYRIEYMQTDTHARTILHTLACTNTHTCYHIMTVQSLTPFILPLLRVTGSKIWFPPHNSLHNAISPALNCQDNLYQSRGESPESLSGYSSARQEKQGGGG